jgi:hypothetical protein
MKGIAKAEFQLPDILKQKYDGKYDGGDLAKYTTIYESTIDQEYTFADARAILEDERAYKKLNHGQRLNVARAYAAEICKDLDIRIPEVYFAQYKREKYGMPAALCHGDAECISMNYLTDAQMMKLNLAHEIKHYHQQIVLQDNNYMPAKCPTEKEANEWNNNENYNYWIQPIELDAQKYAVSYNEKKFKPYYLLTREKKFLEQRLYVKEKFDQSLAEKEKESEQ